MYLIRFVHGSCFSFWIWRCYHFPIQHCACNSSTYRKSRLCYAHRESGNENQESYNLSGYHYMVYYRYDCCTPTAGPSGFGEAAADEVEKAALPATKARAAADLAGTLVSNTGSLQAAESGQSRPFDAMNNIVANLILNLTAYVFMFLFSNVIVDLGNWWVSPEPCKLWRIQIDFMRINMPIKSIICAHWSNWSPHL